MDWKEVFEKIQKDSIAQKQEEQGKLVVLGFWIMLWFFLSGLGFSIALEHFVQFNRTESLLIFLALNWFIWRLK